MRSPEGKILVEGFYDEVVDLSEEDLAAIGRVPFDEAEYLARLGLRDPFGEPGYTTYERAWIRPTLEVNGLWGGFQGDGVKTVLPNEAHAKITCRLVANQDPHRIGELLAAHVNHYAPPGVEVSLTSLSMAGKPYAMPAEHPGNQAARSVLQEIYNREPYYVRTGGSIPICGLFLDHLDAYTVNFAFALEDEGAHAPNEFFRISSFNLGQTAYCKLLYELAHQEL
jgi:acetylornithine deacetylase/succinyl-diaminopimelate desuccinylase-like protein